MRRKTKSITQGAITVAIYGLAVFFSTIAGSFIMPFLSVPMIVYGLYNDFNDSVITYVTSVVTVGLVFGNLPYMVMIALYGLVGIIYNYASKRYNAKIVYLFVVLANCLTYAVMMTFFGTLFGMDINMVVMEVVTIMGVEPGQTATIIAVFVIGLTILMESLIVVMSAKLVVTRLAGRRNR